MEPGSTRYLEKLLTMAGPLQAMYHALPQEGSDSLELELQDSCRGCWEQNTGLDFCGILFMHVYT